MRRIILASLLACLGAPAFSQAPAPASDPAGVARLDAMGKAAYDLDEAASPAAYRKAWDEVLAFARTIYPADHPRLAALEGELVTADYLQGDIAGALARSERITARLRMGGPEWQGDLVDNLNAQVVIHMTLGNHAPARDLGAEVLAARLEEARGKPSTYVSAAWSNLANAEFEFGNYDMAIEFVREAIAVNDRLDPIPANAAPHYGNLAIFLLGAGRLEEAAEAARANQAKLEAFLPKDHPFLSVNLNTLARVLIRLGRLREAEDVARRATDMAVARFGTSQQTVSYMTTLAQALSLQGKHEEALVLAGSATDLLTAAIGAEADRTLNARETRALALGAAGQGEEALAELRAIGNIRAGKGVPWHRDKLGGADRLASLALRLGHPRAALAAQREVQAARAQVIAQDDIDRATGEARLGAIEARLGQARQGLDRARRAAGFLGERLRRIEDSGLSRSGLDREIRAGFGWAFDAALSAGDGEAAFAFAQTAMESAAGRATRAAASRLAAHDPALAARLRERQEAAAQLEALLDRQLRLAGRGAPAEALAALESDRKAAARRLGAARAALGESAAAEQALLLAEARGALGPDEALLVVTVGEARTGLIAATRDKAVLASADAGSQRIGALVERLRGVLEPGNAAPFDMAAAQELHALLLPQAVQGLTRGRSRLLVAANGALSALPFAVLAGPGDHPRWLVEDHALVTLPSISALAQARQAGGVRAVDRFLAIGAPETAPERLGVVADGVAAYRSASMARQVRDLPRLPATAGELRQLGAALAAREQAVLTGASATESALRSAIGSGPQVIAFATHGLVAGEIDGLDEPALVVTPDGADDGLLTASEIMHLRLDADWVLLSACNTAAGSGVDGAGLSGLASAFLFAGGRNLLASHWAVRDDAAAALSTGTVRAYAKGADPAEALRQAMLAMIQGRSLADGADPRLWAPFVYIGR